MWIPNCAVCGRFTTHQMIRTGSSSSGSYEETETWYCKAHEREEA